MDADAEKKLLERIHRIPIVSTMGYEFEGFDEGVCRMRAPYQKGRYDGVFESFHGGLLMTVADSAACFAIFTLTGHDQVATTTDMGIRFLAPCLTDVVAEARVVKLGRTLCPVQVELFDTHGKQVALAQVTYIRLEKMPGR